MGYIIEGKKNHFLTARLNFVKKDGAVDGHVHKTSVTKSLLKAEWQPDNAPTRAYPAEYNWNTRSTRIIGEALSWEQLREKILVK